MMTLYLQHWTVLMTMGTLNKKCKLLGYVILVLTILFRNIKKFLRLRQLRRQQKRRRTRYLVLLSPKNGNVLVLIK